MNRQFVTTITKKTGKYDKKTRVAEEMSLTYTIVMIEDKVVRIFNHYKHRTGYIVYNSIQPTSEIFLLLQKKYDSIAEQNKAFIPEEQIPFV